MASEITKSIQILCEQKGLDVNVVMEALESALGAAYRKDFGNRQQNIQVTFDPETGDMKVWDEKEVAEDVEEDVLEAAQEELAKRREEARKEERELTEEVEDLVRFNPKTQIMLTAAKEIKKDAKIGDVLHIDLEVPGDFGRMAAQTAKQVIIQKLREAERGVVYEDLKEQEGTIISGFIQRRNRDGGFIIDLGKVTGIMPQSESVRREHYKPGNRMQFFLSSVGMGVRGPEIILSRTDKRMVETVFIQEIPEIESGEVEIKGIAREAGNRSKVAVYTADESIDPIGSCIGQRGSRITTIIDELGGEKIDIIEHSDDAVQYIKNALSPAKVESVGLDEETKEAVAHVQDDQFSLAIGREGQNVRLAADLTGWKIKVHNAGSDEEVSSEEEVSTEPEEAKEEAPEEAVTEEKVETPEETAPEAVEEAPEKTEEAESTDEKEAK